MRVRVRARERGSYWRSPMNARERECSSYARKREKRVYVEKANNEEEGKERKRKIGASPPPMYISIQRCTLCVYCVKERVRELQRAGWGNEGKTIWRTSARRRARWRLVCAAAREKKERKLHAPRGNRCRVTCCRNLGEDCPGEPTVKTWLEPSFLFRELSAARTKVPSHRCRCHSTGSCMCLCIGAPPPPTTTTTRDSDRRKSYAGSSLRKQRILLILPENHPLELLSVKHYLNRGVLCREAPRALHWSNRERERERETETDNKNRVGSNASEPRFFRTSSSRIYFTIFQMLSFTYIP
ncbi:hypothetical protein TSAR_008183 [Trichomalopsis sarcophagae]|uniref:Uncharacterized protein n=1 Tax=Trichomalopsis sarcophagae TaxID=543379 RepID=A0A232FE07_9HYME|nr:hypothetical protein TSAR_008183 [Trichomalopsis sarcophagae]